MTQPSGNGQNWHPGGGEWSGDNWNPGGGHYDSGGHSPRGRAPKAIARPQVSRLASLLQKAAKGQPKQAWHPPLTAPDLIIEDVTHGRLNKEGYQEEDTDLPNLVIEEETPVDIWKLATTPVPKLIHQTRDFFNRPNRATLDMKPKEAIYHTWDIPGVVNGTGNIKTISTDGKHEAVRGPDGNLVVDPINRGTYNYAHPDEFFSIPHALVDVLPYYLWGNGPDDPTTFKQRVMRRFDYPPFDDW
jgi:hypothetical protein